MGFIAFIFIVFAAFFNAVMDRVETTISFNDSIFVKYSRAFWCKPVSAHNIQFIKFTKYRPDGWHLSKSAMIVCLSFAFAWVSLWPIYIIPMKEWWWLVVNYILIILLFGVIWNYTFELFYSKILKTKS